MVSKICRHCKEEFGFDFGLGKPGFIDECPACLNWNPPSRQKPIEISLSDPKFVAKRKKSNIFIGPLPKSPHYGKQLAGSRVRLSKKEKRKRRRNARRLIREHSNSKTTSKEKQIYANQMRANMTDAEQYIWPDLKKLGFLAQQVVFGYIPDFYHYLYSTIVEIDGGYHDEEKQKIYDKRKDDYLKSKCIKVLRFKNEEVFRHLENVLKEIKDSLMNN